MMETRLFEKDLTTQRLRMRKPEASDIPYHFDFVSDKNNFPYADYKVALSYADVEDYFDKVMSYQLISSLFWMICDKNTNIPIGTVSAWNVDYEVNSIEFGYALYPRYRRKGYMYEALSAVIDFCVQELKFTVLDIWTEKHNQQSIRLAERLGFVFQGYVKEDAKFIEGQIEYATYRKLVNE